MELNPLDSRLTAMSTRMRAAGDTDAADRTRRVRRLRA